MILIILLALSQLFFITLACAAADPIPRGYTATSRQRRQWRKDRERMGFRR